MLLTNGIVTKFPSYFFSQIYYLSTLSGNFGSIYPMNLIHMLLSEINQEDDNSISLLSNAEYQKSVSLDFVREQVTYFKHPNATAKTVYIDAVVQAASKQPVSIASSCSLWCHHPIWAQLQIRAVAVTHCHCTGSAESLLLPAWLCLSLAPSPTALSVPQVLFWRGLRYL